MKKLLKYISKKKWFKALYGEWFIEESEEAIIMMDEGWELVVPAKQVRFK